MLPPEPELLGLGDGDGLGVADGLGVLDGRGVPDGLGFPDWVLLPDGVVPARRGGDPCRTRAAAMALRSWMAGLGRRPGAGTGRSRRAPRRLVEVLGQRRRQAGERDPDPGDDDDHRRRGGEQQDAAPGAPGHG